MEITNCRRILAVGKPDCGLLDLLKGLTGTSPSPTPTLAGLSHTYPITTPYYSATIPIWLDEITTPPTWASEFLKPEAREVLNVLGAFIVCFRKPVDEKELEGIKELMEAVQEVVKEGCGFAWDGVCLAVGMKQSVTPCLERGFEEWEDLCQDCGFEFVDFEAGGRNEFGEPMGKGRLKEALEANDWAAIDPDDDFDFEALNEDDDEGSTGFGIEATELEMEMFGMKHAVHEERGTEEDQDGDDKEDEIKEDEIKEDEIKEDEIKEDETKKEPTEETEEGVEQLESMMMRLQAVRDMGADMPERERKKFAAKAVNDLLKTL